MSEREVDWFVALARGASIAEVAQRAGVSKGIVSGHVNRRIKAPRNAAQADLRDLRILDRLGLGESPRRISDALGVSLDHVEALEQEARAHG